MLNNIIKNRYKRFRHSDIQSLDESHTAAIDRPWLTHLYTTIQFFKARQSSCCALKPYLMSYM